LNLSAIFYEHRSHVFWQNGTQRSHWQHPTRRLRRTQASLLTRLEHMGPGAGFGLGEGLGPGEGDGEGEGPGEPTSPTTPTQVPVGKDKVQKCLLKGLVQQVPRLCIWLLWGRLHVRFIPHPILCPICMQIGWRSDSASDFPSDRNRRLFSTDTRL
jgi:hypothetical protein